MEKKQDLNIVDYIDKKVYELEKLSLQDKLLIRNLIIGKVFSHDFYDGTHDRYVINNSFSEKISNINFKISDDYPIKYNDGLNGEECYLSSAEAEQIILSEKMMDNFDNLYKALMKTSNLKELSSIIGYDKDIFDEQNMDFLRGVSPLIHSYIGNAEVKKRFFKSIQNSNDNEHELCQSTIEGLRQIVYSSKDIENIYSHIMKPIINDVYDHFSFDEKLENKKNKSITFAFIEIDSSINLSNKDENTPFSIFTNDNDSVFKNEALEKRGVKKFTSKDLNIDNNNETESYMIRHNEEWGLYNFITEHKLDLINNHVPDFYGIRYLKRNDFNVNQENRFQFLIAMMNNEVVGVMAFGSKFDKKNQKSTVFYSKSTAVKSNYRNIGISRMMYNKTSEILHDIKGIFVSSGYTKDGLSKLSKMKSELNKRYDCFYLETDPSFFSKENKDGFSSIFHENALRTLGLIESIGVKSNGQSAKIKEFNSSLADETIKAINENRGFMYSYDAPIDLFKKEKVKLLNKLKEKKRNHKF